MSKDLEIYLLIQEFESLLAEYSYLDSKSEYLKTLIKQNLNGQDYHHGRYSVTYDGDDIKIDIE